MVKKKSLHIKKLSTSMPLASYSNTISRLISLQGFIRKASEITENMTTTIEHVRQAGASILQQVSYSVKENQQFFTNSFNLCSDVVIREIKIANNPKYTAIIVYIDGMVRQELIEESIIKKLSAKPVDDTLSPDIETYVQYLLGIRAEDIHSDLTKVVEAILNSKLVLIIDGVNQGLTIDFKNPPARNVEQPESEISLRGPKEGFTESLRTNTCLLRKKIKNIHLKIESHTLGTQTKTDLVISYLSGIANDKIVNELRSRLNNIEIDAILGSNYIQEYIKDSPFFIFPSIYATEKPDVVSAKLLEGYIAILVDGTPIVLIVPCLFIDFFKAIDDYHLNFIPATINRWVRYFAFIASINLPGFYVSLLTFHQELIPDALVSTIIKSRVGVPLPLLWECFLMLVTYEVLREAGIRMPRMIGSAVSIVGALVLGQSAVEAGLVSTLTVVVIGFTAIASLTMPSPDMGMALIYPRFLLLFLSGTLGMLGLIGGVMMLFINMISARSFGVPYMGPFAPLVLKDLADATIRSPLPSLIKRSKLINWKQSVRRKNKRNPL